MKSISKIALGIAPSATLAMNALSQEMKANGIDVIGFGAGEPDFNTPEHIKLAGIEAINTDKSHYTTASGIAPLKEAICKFLDKRSGLKYAPKQICVSSGAKHIIYIVLQTLLNQGDEVIVPAPYWVTYAEAIRMCGGVPVIVETKEEENFKMSPEMLQAAVTDKTKCVIMTNPSNPTGMLYSKDELVDLCDVIVKNDLYLMSDEIYASLVYKGEFFSPAALNDEMKERTIIVDGVSKTYAMTGWRIGYCAANEQIAAAMNTYLGHSTGNPSNIAQYAAVAAYSGDQSCAAYMKGEFDKRRKYIVKRINEMDGISCLEPDGAFYVFINVKGQYGRKVGDITINSSADFAEALLKYDLVATVPGNAFGADGYIRWSYATSMENIVKGLDRLENFLKR